MCIEDANHNLQKIGQVDFFSILSETSFFFFVAVDKGPYDPFCTLAHIIFPLNFSRLSPHLISVKW